jgi:hypothetical protein
MGYWPPDRRHRIQTRMNIDDCDDPKFREYGSNWKCGFKTVSSRRDNPRLTADAIREIDFEFEGLKPYFKVDSNAL